jgi:IclR family pca regulon transcriptional regulator
VTDEAPETGTKRRVEWMGGLAKGLAIIEALGPDRRELTVSEAARVVSTSPAAARRCLLTLTELGYLHQDGRHFRPTPRMMRLGDAYLSGSTLAALAQSYAEAGRDVLGEAVSVAIYDDGSALFIARAPVQRIVSLGVRLGARLPAYASATGRVLLAGMPSEQREEYLRNCRPKATTPNSLTRIADIRERIERAAADGYALTDGELELGIRTLAVPVTDASGRVQAAMSTAAFSARVGLEEMLATYVPGLREQATALGRML